MFRHVVMFKWTDDVDDAHVARVGEGLDQLARTIGEIRDYRHGPDAGINADNHDYVVVGDFDSAADYETYRDHPTHQELIRDLIAGRISARAAVQYEF